MTNRDASNRSLEGPYSHHLYIGFAPSNRKTAFDLQRKLAEQEVICCRRSTNNNIEASIREGVGSSQKCLLLLTSDYLKDDWYNMETSTVIEKSENFSPDAVIILKGEDLEVIPETLREFTAYPFRPEYLNDTIFMAQFADVITQEPYLKLTVLSKQNSGYGSARNYFYGYLRLVLPDFKKRLLEQTLRNEPQLVQKTVQKMLIIMPESCFCTTKFDSPNQIEFTEKYLVAVAHRAGNNKRDFKNSLYRLIDHERQEEYYFVGEFATPLLTIYDAYVQGLCGMTMDHLNAERDAFYNTLKAILSHPGNAGCNGQFKLLYWSDPETKKQNQLDLYNFLLPKLRNEIQLQRQKEINPPERGAANSAHLLLENSQRLNTFEIVQAHGCNPSRVFDDVVIKKYPMDRRPRGLCRIINVVNFDTSQTHLTHREGGDKDEGILKKLFEDYHFLVKVYKDVDAQTLELIFSDIQDTNHENYDAFVCCILTHGKLGVIYTSDGKEIQILSLVDYISEKNCLSLKGKPKMFFIQACQSGDPEPESGIAENFIPHDGSTGIHSILSSSQKTSDSVANMESQHLTACEMVESAQDGICSTQIAELEIKEDAVGVQPTMLDKTSSSLLTVNHKSVLIPNSPDFLMSYSTLPGSLSYRDTETGSLYVQALNEHLRKDMDIERALKLVTETVEKKLRQLGEHDGDEERFQLPFHLTSAMYRSIYL